MQIFKNCIESFKEKPIVYLVFLLSIIISVVVSCTFYRLSKAQAQGVDPYTSAYFSVGKDYNPSEMYDIVKSSKAITNVKHFASKDFTEEFEGDVKSISIDYVINYTDKSGDFSIEELEKGDKLIKVSLKYARDYGIDIGGAVELSGEQYTVIGKTDKSNSYELSLMASSLTAMPEGVESPFPRFVILSRKALDAALISELEGVGLQYLSAKSFDATALIPIFIGIFVMLLATVNVCVAYAYILKRNGKRYNVYKTVGAKNRFIYGAVATEVGATLIAGFAIGGLIEGFAVKPFLKVFMTSLSPLDYLAIAAINVLFIALTVALVAYRLVGGKPAENKRLSEV